MIELKNKEQLKNAIERARADRKSLFVQLTDVARSIPRHESPKRQHLCCQFSNQ
ncbi:MAG TPA: hypothetical protein VF596_04075 [Pyrinomonadaceae bacterium]|jgi:hypothetical protein